MDDLLGRPLGSYVHRETTDADDDTGGGVGHRTQGHAGGPSRPSWLHRSSPWEALRRLGLEPDLHLGHSLGEVSALGRRGGPRPGDGRPGGRTAGPRHGRVGRPPDSWAHARGGGAPGACGRRWWRSCRAWRSPTTMRRVRRWPQAPAPGSSRLRAVGAAVGLAARRIPCIPCLPLGDRGAGRGAPRGGSGGGDVPAPSMATVVLVVHRGRAGRGHRPPLASGPARAASGGRFVDAVPAAAEHGPNRCGWRWDRAAS